jgi:hypothetical protein
VSLATLKPNEGLSLKYRVPRRGLVEFVVEAERPVHTYVLDPEGLDAFNHGKTDRSFGGFMTRQRHHQELRLPFKGTWYLVILNPHDEPVAIGYDVYY